MGLRVRALGSLTVELDGKAVEVGGRRVRAVLIVLLVYANRACAIDRLVEECWDGSPPPSARNSLQSHVSRLRRTLGGSARIRVDGDHYRLNIDADEFDVAEFEAGCDEVRPKGTESPNPEMAARCRQLLELWRGPPFEGGEIPRCAQHRALELNERRTELAEMAIEAELIDGETSAEIIAEIRALVADNPWREPLRRLLAIALYVSGRQTEALRELSGFRRLLADEAGLIASGVIAATEQIILDHRPPFERSVAEGPPLSTNDDLLATMSSAATSLPIDLARLVATPLVGREAGLQRLRSTFAEHSESTSFACIVGEPGIGKSRLAAELAAERGAAGEPVLYGRCSAILDLPFQPFAQALAGLVEGSGLDEAALGPLIGSTAVRAEWTIDHPNIASGWSRMFDAVTTLVDRLCTQHRLLLVIDDLQWASSPTMALLEHLITVGRPTGLSVVATLRDTDVPPDAPVMTLLGEMRRHGHADIIRLDGLSAADVGRLLTLRTGADVSTDSSDVVQLCAASAGNPLLLSHLLDDGERDWSQHDGADRAPRALGDAGSIPRAIAEQVRQRVVRLGTDDRVLDVAALIGVDFESDILALVVRTDPLDALERASQAGLVSELAAGRWIFRHGLTRDALIGRLSATRQRNIHARIADAIIDAHGTDDPAFVGRAARHACAGATRATAEWAVDLATRAANARASQLSPEESLSHVSDAERVVEVVGGVSPQGQAEIYLAAADVLLGVADFPARDRAIEQAAAAARRAGSADHLAFAAINRASYYEYGAIDDEAVDLINEALDALADDSVALRSRLLAQLALLAAEAGAKPLIVAGSRNERVDPLSTAQHAVDLADQCGDSRARTISRGSLIVALGAGPDASRQIQLAESLANGHPDSVASAARWSAAARLTLGDRAGFRTAVEQARDIGAEIGSWNVVAFGLQCAAMDSMMDGEFAQARDLAAQAVAMSRNDPNFLRVNETQLFWCAYEQDQMEELLPFVELTLAANPHIPAIRAMYGVSLSRTGDLTNAAAELATLARDDFAGIPRDLLWTGAMCGACEIAATIGHRTVAATLSSLLEPYAGQLCIVGYRAFVYGASDRFRAMAAAIDGDVDAAVELFESAAQLEDRVGARVLADRTRWWSRKDFGQPGRQPFGT